MFIYIYRAVADYLSIGVTIPGITVRETDVFMMSGGTQAIQMCIAVLARQHSRSNLLLPRPGFAPYEAACELFGVEPRYYDLVPQRGWEVDLAQVRHLTDSETVGLVIITPNNPCGAVYSVAHQLQVWIWQLRTSYFFKRVRLDLYSVDYTVPEMGICNRNTDYIKAH